MWNCLLKSQSVWGKWMTFWGLILEPSYSGHTIAHTVNHYNSFLNIWKETERGKCNLAFKSPTCLSSTNSHTQESLTLDNISKSTLSILLRRSCMLVIKNSGFNIHTNTFKWPSLGRVCVDKVCIKVCIGLINTDVQAVNVNAKLKHSER